MILDRIILRKQDPYQVRMAKSAAWLYWLGIAVMLAGAFLPVDTEVDRTPVFLLAGLGFVATLVLIVFPWRIFSLRVFYAMAGMACLHVATLVYYSGGVESPYGLLYFLIAIWAAYFFSFTGFSLVAAMIITSYLAPYVYDRGFDMAHVATGLTHILFLLIAGGLVNLLVTQLRSRTFDLRDSYEQLDRKVREVNQEKEKAHAVIESVADGVYVVDNNRRIILWNKAAEKITGFREKEMLGQICAKAVTDAGEGCGYECAPVCDIAAQLDGRSGSVSYEVLTRKRGGEKMWLSVSAAPISDPEGNMAGVVHVFRDISEYKEIDRMKSDFVATVSHELRTPLTSILGFSKTLLRNDVNFPEPSRESFLLEIVREGERLARLIEDVLSVSRIEAGNLQLDLKAADPAPTIHQVVKNVSFLTSIHSFVVNVPDGLGQVQADIDKLYQVLLNLLVNAIKYSPEGGQIVVSASEEDDCVRFMVVDQGIGISGDHLPHIFERFYRVDDSGRRGVTGTGLGLYVSRNLIEEMGGRMWVESTEGEGSRFYFELPLVHFEPEPRKAQKKLASRGETR